METVQLRVEVSSKTSAEVSYLAKRLGISKKKTYALMMDLFLFERDLDKAYTNLNNYLFMRGAPDPDEPPDDLPSE